MLKQLTAVALTALAAAACSVEGTSSEALGTQVQEIVSCGVTGLEWKPFLAHLAYDAAEDFGRWEFTTDLEQSGDHLIISAAGYSLCASRGRSGCPAMTAGLSAQEGNTEVQNSSGKVIMNPMSIREQLVQGFIAQQNNELNGQWVGDNSETSPYNNFQVATKTGLPHSITLTNCAATVYADPNYAGSSQCLRTGTYRMADLKGVGNDKVSSIKVRSGMKVTMYENDQFAGTSLVATKDSATLSMNDKTSSLVVSAADTVSCSAVDSYKVSTTGDWTKIRGKLVTLGYMRGNDVLDVRLDIPNNTIDVDPFNVDFVPPSQIGGATYGVAVKSDTAETWRSTEDPAPSIFPIGSSCKKKSYLGTTFLPGIVKASGSYRYCFL